MPRLIYKRRTSPVWQTRFRSGGILVRLSTGCTDEQAAMRFAQNLQIEMERWRVGLRESDPRKCAEGTASLVAEYGRELRRRGYSEKNARTIERELRNFADAHPTAKGLTTKAGRDWLASKENLAQGTIDSYKARLCAFGSWLEKKGVLPGNPWTGSRIGPLEGRQTARRRALTPGEVQALLATAPPERSLWYRLAVETGMRFSELEQLSLDWVERDPPAIRIPAWASKNKKPRRVPLRPDTLESVVVRLFDHSGVFVEDPPEHRAWRGDFKRAGVRPNEDGNPTFHSLRHTCNTTMARAGIPATVRMAMLGHTTERVNEKTYVDATKAVPQTTPRDLAAALGM